MKKGVTLVLAVAAVPVAGIAYAAQSPSGFPHGDVVVGGGHAVILGFDRTFSIGAINGKGTVVRSGLVHRVTCETVVGNAAVVGGPSAQVAGDFYELEVVDNGLPVNGPAGDQISPFVIDVGSAPTTCPTPSQLGAIELDTVDAGDVTVNSS